MPDIVANGIRFHYIDCGSGMAMFWLHGLCGSSEAWRDTMSHFRDRFHVIAYDARGHGLSENPENPEAYSQDSMLDDLRAIMDRLDITQAIIGGHSMGAGVALNFALQYPERCLGLVLVGIGSGGSNPRWWQQWWDKLADLAENKGMSAALEEMNSLPAWQSAFRNPQIGNQVSEEILHNCAKSIAYTIRGVQRKRPSIFGLEPRLKECRTGTLVVMSEHDTPVKGSSRFIAECMPNAVLKVLPARSHWTYREAPEKFLNAVDDFLTHPL
jgi:pimeloyl-ACP methyl ester carboxylesterase